MISYLFIFCCLIILYLLSLVKLEDDIKITINYLTVIIMSLFLGGAYLNGTDWIFYQIHYEKIPYIYNIIELKNWMSNSIYSRWGESYQILISLSKTFISFEFFRFIYLTLCICFIMKKSQEYTRNIMLFNSIFYLLFIEVGLEPLMRQILAILIFINSVDYIYQKKWFKYIISILIAATFHKSAILLLPLYWLNLKKKRIRLSTIFLILLVLITQINGIILKLNQLNIIDYSHYTNEKLILGSTSLLNQFKEILYLYPIFYISIRKIKLTKKENLIFSFSVIWFVLKFLATKFPMTVRYTIYFDFYYSLLWCICIKKSLRKEKVISSLILGVILFGNSMFLWKKMNYLRKYNPYTNYFVELYKNSDLSKGDKITESLKKRNLKIGGH